MSNKRIEDLAIIKLEEAIYKSEYLESFIDSNDKTPSWDGYIFVYNSKKHTKTSLSGRVPIQVKGTKSEDFIKPTIKYPVQISDLKNYLSDSGVLYFVVQIDEQQNASIYYSNLLPIDINEYLSMARPNQKSILVELIYLDYSSVSSIDNLCNNFLVHRKLQSSTYLYKKQIEDFNEILLPVVSTTLNYEDYILHNPIYIYGKTNEISIPIPIDKISIETISKQIEKSISIDSTIYYNYYESIQTKYGGLLKIGKKITWNLATGKLDFIAVGSLNERIKDTQFICDLIKAGSFYIGDIRVSSISTPREKEDDMNEYLKYLLDIRSLLGFFHIDIDFSMDSLTENDYANISSMIAVILYNKKGKLQNLEQGINHLQLGDLVVTVIINIDENGYTHLDNFYSDVYKTHKYIVHYKDDPQDYEYSIYTILKAADISKASNLSTEIIEKSVQSIELSEYYATQVNFLILELIKAYDINNELENCLNTALSLCLWLENYDNDFLVYKLNKLQIYKRRRVLTNEEIGFLIQARQEEESLLLKCGISILLDNLNDFDYYHKKLSADEQKELSDYPIYTLVKRD